MDTLPQALKSFTDRYCELWRHEYGGQPASAALSGIASPCIIDDNNSIVRWRPVPFNLERNLAAVERAMDITLRPEAHQFYTTQYAGDMAARHKDLPLTLLQTWNENDFDRVQQNLIGHLVTQRRLKLSPTVFLATLASELEVVSLCNLSGEVVIESLGTASRQTIASDIGEFLDLLTPLAEWPEIV